MSKKRKTILVVISSTIAVLALFIMTFVIINAHKNVSYGEFIPPEFDDNAIIGEPDVPENSGYSLMNIADDYNIYICGNPEVVDQDVFVYFTSDVSNSVWIKLIIETDNGNVLGETGLIKPGEYIQKIRVKEKLKGDVSVKYRVIGYEPGSYYSAGSANMKTTIEFKQ